MKILAPPPRTVVKTSLLLFTVLFIFSFDVIKAQTTIDLRGMIGRITEPSNENSIRMNALPGLKISTKNTSSDPNESRSPVTSHPAVNYTQNDTSWYNHSSGGYTYDTIKNEYELDPIEGNKLFSHRGLKHLRYNAYKGTYFAT